MNIIFVSNSYYYTERIWGFNSEGKDFNTRKMMMMIVLDFLKNIDSRKINELSIFVFTTNIIPLLISFPLFHLFFYKVNPWTHFVLGRLQGP